MNRRKVQKWTGTAEDRAEMAAFANSIPREETAFLLEMFPEMENDTTVYPWDIKKETS